MRKLFKIIHFVNNHPLTKDNKTRAFFRFFKWQVMSRLCSYPIICPFVEGSKLIVKKGMTGATGNLYVGLHEFEEMAFLLHFLRKDDLFGDIGANIGSYTVLASAVVKANSITVEPIPSTFKHLKNNIQINELEDLVVPYNIGIGGSERSLFFAKNLDTINHVVEKNVDGSDTIVVEVQTLDKLFTAKFPVLLKIDVEGFEMNVLKGGYNVLTSLELKAIIIELNGSGNRYGISDKDVHNFLLSYNFSACSYKPFKRKLISISEPLKYGNTIYIRDKSFVEERMQGSRSYSVLGKSF